MAGKWRGLIDNDTGVLITYSDGEIVANKNQSIVDLDHQPDFSPGADDWDTVKLTLIPRAAKVLVDRWDDLLADPKFQTVYTTTILKQDLKDTVIALLGAQRYRNANEDTEIK